MKNRGRKSKFKPQYRRLLFIDRKIREGSCPNCFSLGQEWEVSYKTIQRDIDYLKYELDAPIDYDPVKRGFFYSDHTWFLPSLLLTEGELMALLIGTQALDMYQGTPVAGTLREIYQKLAELLPDKITLAPEMLYDRMSFINAPARAICDDIWKAVIRGLMHQRVMQIDYKSPKSPHAKRHQIHPLHLANIEGDWYLLAFAPRFEDITQYAVSRIRHAEVGEPTFQPPPEFEAAAVLKKRFGKYIHRAGEEALVKVRFSAELAAFVGEKTWHPQQKLQPGKDGTVELTVPTVAPETMLPWIMSFGAHAEVLAPSVLRALLRCELQKMAQQY
jgi:proteasome accessory factor B